LFDGSREKINLEQRWGKKREDKWKTKTQNKQSERFFAWSNA